METVLTQPAPGAGAELSVAQRRGPMRWFFAALAWFYVVVAIVGFTPSFIEYFAGRLELPWTAHVHGAVMLSWMLFYAAQTTLAASSNLVRHRALGSIAIWLAAAVVFVMGMATVTALARFKPQIGDFLYDILAAQIAFMMLFAAFVLWGVLARRNASWHRRVLTLASVLLLQAAVDRMFWLPDEGLPMFWHQAIKLYAIILPLFAFDLLTLRRIHPATLIGTAFIVATHWVISALWQNPGWHALAHSVTSTWR